MHARPLSLALSGLVVLSACTSTQPKLVETWRAPGTVQVSFDKVLAVAFIADAEMRRDLENAMVREIKGAQAVASHTLIDKAEERDSEKIKSRLRDAGFDGAVTLKLVGADEIMAAKPNSNDPFWGYYHDSWPVVYETGYLEGYRVIRIETGIYSLREDKKIWSAVTRNVDPQSEAGLIHDIASTVGRELRRQKLVE